MRWRAEYLGLRGTHPRRDGFRDSPVWSDVDVAKAPRRVRQGAEPPSRRRARPQLRRDDVPGASLGIQHGWMRAFSPDEDQAIRIAWERGVSMVDVAQAMGRDPAVIGKHAARLGYRFE